MVSRFGTSQEMLIQSVEENQCQFHLAIDNKGLYLTEGKYLIRDIADPNRCSNRAEMAARIKALGINYEEIFEANKHLIVQMPTEAARKVNPLKASKRSMKK